jgi:hypothetical protein
MMFTQHQQLTAYFCSVSNKKKVVNKLNALRKSNEIVFIGV